MKTVILDGTNTSLQITETLCAYLKDEQHAYFRLKDLKILPCRCCGSCEHKTPGECVIKDDMPDILKNIADCDTMVFLTPIRYGGYGSELKKAVDRLMVLGLPLYMVKGGHLLHPMRYDEKSLIVIGLAEKDLLEQEESFRLLSANNALNFGSRHQTVILSPADDVGKIRNAIGRAFEEARKS